MLQGMREGARSPWILVIIGLIVLSFVLTGAESLTFNGSQSGAAEVSPDEGPVHQGNYWNARA